MSKQNNIILNNLKLTRFVSGIVNKYKLLLLTNQMYSKQSND